MAKPKGVSSRRRGASAAARTERLVVRRMRVTDIAAIRELQRRCFPGISPFSEEQLRAQIARFGQGQIVVLLDGELVATSSSLIVDGSAYQEPHTYEQICGDGTLANHDPEGDMLYGIDIAVDPRFRGFRLSRRLYDERKELVRKLNLRGIMIGGRAPQYHKHARMEFGDYLRKVVSKTLRDPTITAQISNGFTIRCALPGYLPGDRESCGNAVLMEWADPTYAPARGKKRFSLVRVAAVQYQLRSLDSFEEFCAQCEFYLETAADYRCDFIVFPELLTTQLQSLVTAERPGLAVRRLDEFTHRYIEFFNRAAIRYAVNILAGTHLVVEDDALYNAAYLFRRDGSMQRQLKLHITPSEQRWWGVTPGRQLEVFDTDRGPIAILIGYDIEFPEVSRVAAQKGAMLYFVPYNTDIRQVHMRFRACAQARCIENNVYCVLVGAVGNLPLVEGADIHYAESAILTPCDIPFPRDGVATKASPNVETMLVHDLDMSVLRRSRRSGILRPWQDRRTDIYAVRYRDEEV